MEQLLFNACVEPLETFDEFFLASLESFTQFLEQLSVSGNKNDGGFVKSGSRVPTMKLVIRKTVS